MIDILCESFDTNKSVNYVVKQDKNRKKRIRKLMEYSFDLCYLFGDVYLSDDKKACALTMLPDKKKTTLKTVMLDAKLAVSCVGLSRVGKILKRDSKIKSQYPKDPIYYLWFIGVNTNEQGKGIGSALLKQLIKESDALKRPIYLETSVPENIRFYNKHGFNIYNELDFGYKLFLVKRDLN
ncbi:MAG: GNAT family N-acetyltransferase [Bacteroidota bacterium]